MLVGGKGTRIHSVVKDRPKPITDINGRLFLDKLIEYVSSFGHDRFILCDGHMAEYLTNYYQDMNLPHEIVLSIERIPLGTPGAVKMLKNLSKQTFFV
jgi:D-glycero-alpha-D-manno-heptose 1-phosphate guanylyltransferase